MGKFNNALRIKLLIINSMIPLIIGGFIYVAYRSKSLRMFKWFEYLNVTYISDFIRNILYPTKEILPEWVYYSLPDGLWVYSFSSSLIIIWGNNNVVKLWLIIPLLSGAFVEILQFFNIFPGTFDIVDLFICLLASFFSILIVKLKLLKK